MTYFPPDLSPKDSGQYVVSAENVRAERGVLKAAPGYERIHTKETSLDGPANLIFQSSIVAVDRESQTTPIIGTEGKVYIVRRRARQLVCSDCEVTFAVVGDSGRITPSGDGSVPLADVAALVRSWSPEFVLHVGDTVYSGGGAEFDSNPYEVYVAQYFYPFLGGYSGVYGKGSSVNKFFPTLGNHDWTDGPDYRYRNFYQLPPPETYYTVKRGPVQIFVINSYGYGPTSTGPYGASIGGTGSAIGVGESDLSWETSPQAVWLRAAVAASDTAWRVVVFHHPAHTSEANYYPGFAVMDWPWQDIGIDLVLNGHSHVYERIIRDGVTRIICGLGGQSRRSFVTPAFTYEALTDEHGNVLTTEFGIPIYASVPALTPGPYYDYVDGSEARYSSDYGALKVIADRGQLRGMFYTRDGDLIDSFSLTSQRVSTACYILDAAKRVQSIEVIPGNVTTEVDGTFQLLAYVYYVDGSREDITHKAAWSVSDTSVVSIDSGLITGINPGNTTATATYLGMSDSADVEVLVKCVDDPLDLVLVLDESYSMWDASGTSTRIKRLQEAANLAVNAISNGPGDRLGVLTFNGDFQSQLPLVYQRASLGSPLHFCRSAINDMVPSGATAIASAIVAGHRELMDVFPPRSGRKVLVLFTDGYANIVDGYPTPPSGSIYTDAMTSATVAADAAKVDGITIMVVALDLRYDPTREATMAGWASEGFYYHADDADQLLGIFANLLGDLCREGEYYSLELPLSIGTSLLTV